MSPTASTYLSIWSQADPQPYTSTVNSNPRQTVANAAFVDTDYNVFNASGRTDVLVDVSGRFDFYAGPAAKQAARGRPPGRRRSHRARRRGYRITIRPGTDAGRSGGSHPTRVRPSGPSTSSDLPGSQRR